MSSSTAAHLMVLFLAATALCVNASQPANGASCGPPQEGVYRAEYSYPTELGGSDQVVQARGVLNLLNEGIGYHGTGAGVAFNSQVEELYPYNDQFSINVWAVFDSETCTLSGAMYNHASRIVNAFEWNYDGKVISGPFAIRLNETVPFPVEAYAVFVPTF